MKRAVLAGLIVIAACGGNKDSSGKGDAGTGGDGGNNGPIDADSCEAPDMLVLLDRTMSMHRRPDGTVPPDTVQGRAESKWSLAILAIEALTAEVQTSIRFGLTLFPRDPGGDKCVTLSQRINGQTATNPQCEAGEELVAPAISTAAAIAAALDPDTTLLCTSTPVGAGLGTARDALAAVQDPIRDQYVMLVSDGADTCNEPLVLANTNALAAAGVKTYVVAFDGSGNGIDKGLLNDVACAGRTAPGFPTPCTVDGNGDYRATDRDGAVLFLQAENSATLVDAFRDVAGQVCCGCVL